jgi:hypothetical protein
MESNLETLWKFPSQHLQTLQENWTKIEKINRNVLTTQRVEAKERENLVTGKVRNGQGLHKQFGGLIPIVDTNLNRDTSSYLSL